MTPLILTICSLGQPCMTIVIDSPRPGECPAFIEAIWQAEHPHILQCREAGEEEAKAINERENNV